MTPMINRRGFMGLMAGAAAAGLVPGVLPAMAAEAGGLPLGDAKSFSFDGVIAWAREQATKPYQPPQISNALSEVLAKIDYDAYQKIKFDPNRALWRGQNGILPVRPFHQNSGTREKVRLYQVENGRAREVLYDPAAFSYGGAIKRSDMPEDAGWGGFRVMGEKDPNRDWLAFMGASYFRSAGPMDQYGLSARAVAVNIGLPDTQEEFPRFTEFWLEPTGQDHMNIYALLDGPSITGAIRIACAGPNDRDVVLNVTTHFFMRKDVTRLGIAPLTSMFWFSETNRDDAADWRPEIHDSDGLAVWTDPQKNGQGTRIWRPLDNPAQTRISHFDATGLRGFGLMQRDRQFHDYEDDGVFYDRRPSLWIEPKGDWPDGAVQLLEIPTDDEIHDNIGAYWTLDQGAKAGSALSYQYRMHWMKNAVFGQSNLGHVIATRTGRAGVPGQPRPKTGLKYAIDFAGGNLADYTTEQKALKPDISAPGADIRNAYCLRVVGQDYWRLVFDIFPQGPGDGHPVDIQARLVLNDGTPVSEDWIFTHRPHHFA
jgi:glucans biosynthesis protein